LPSFDFYGIVKETTNNGEKIWVGIEPPHRQMVAKQGADGQLGILPINFSVSQTQARMKVRVLCKYREFEAIDDIVKVCIKYALDMRVSVSFEGGSRYFFDKQALAYMNDFYAVIDFETTLWN
jgi:hypothetical protein